MADSISDIRNIAHSVTNTADSSVNFSGQGVAPQKNENEHRQPSVEKDAALSTCQTRLEPGGSKAGLLDNISERSSPVSSEKMTAEQRQQYFEEIEKLEQQLNELLSLLEPGFNASEIEQIQEFIDVGEYGLAFETLVAVAHGRSIEASQEISQEVSLLMEDTGKMMEMDVEAIKKDITRRMSGSGNRT